MAGLPYLSTALLNLFRSPVTENFPKGPAPEASPMYRGRIIYDASKCINCGMCERACAPHCMTREQKPYTDGEPGDMEITFTFDMTSCTFCGLCADFCSKKAITLSPDYMMVGEKNEDFLVTGTFIKKAPKKPVKPLAPKQEAVPKAENAPKAEAVPKVENAPKPEAVPKVENAPKQETVPQAENA